MYHLKNNELDVEILDPIIDRKSLGSRYCTGCYIFQIKDSRLGNLLSGPQYPNPHFNVFDGQGAPEVFVNALNQDHVEVGEEVLVLGAGKVERTSPNSPFHVRDNPKVTEFCTWEIEEQTDFITMKTLQKFKNWQLIINKKVTLIERSVTSHTTFENIGQEPIPLKWFAHPFFPIPSNLMCCRFIDPFKFAPNGGYFINNQGFIEMKPEYDWKMGLFQKIEYNPEQTFSALQCHPLLGNISVTSDFIPASLAIWANAQTFSFEPFYETILESGNKRSWSIRYRFFAG